MFFKTPSLCSGKVGMGVVLGREVRKEGNLGFPPWRSPAGCPEGTLGGSRVRRDSDSRGLPRSVTPRVVAPAHDHEITLLHAHLLSIEHEHELAFGDDAEVERLHLLHVGVLR